MKQILLILLFMAVAGFAGRSDSRADTIKIPDSHHNIFYSNGEMIYITAENDTLPLANSAARYTLGLVRTMPGGTENGLAFDFPDSALNGRIYYGFFPHSDETDHLYPIYFGGYAAIKNGHAELDIATRLTGKYDFINWRESGLIHLGYRIVAHDGQILYDGKLRLTGKGPFAVDTCIIEGPLLNMLTHESAIVSMITNFDIRIKIKCNGRVFESDQSSIHHEIKIDGLEPDNEYEYIVFCDDYSQSHKIRTAPRPGSRKPFTFAYASDGRGNAGGGERNIKGVNAYILKRIAVLCNQKKAVFFQFTGDLIDGYTTDVDEIELEYANWKRTIEPFAHSLPFIAGFGNHEVLLHYFSDGEKGVSIDKFPYDTHSSEAIFARNFVNPSNGPDSEDGSVYDPNPETIDFPSYKENVFYYTYDNVAIVSLNSNYWFSPTIKRDGKIGGNLHGYIMDNQLQWLKKTMGILEEDQNIDHIFVTIHTPIFPNGGHVKDDMWYSGDNSKRAYVNGRAVEHGIIERRDQLLDIMLNLSTKVKASLTGDEHNYSLLRIKPGMPLYPEDYGHQKLEGFRPFWHINNGAAGAPYYGREETPWMDHVLKFSTQNAVVFFHVDGHSVQVEVINPDTWETLDEFEL